MMPERHEDAPSPYMRLPAPVVAVALLILLGAALGIGLYANSNLRQPGVVVPTPPAAVPPTIAPPTQTPQPTVVPTPLIVVIPTATPMPTSVPTVIPTVEPTTTPTVSPEEAKEIGDAYQTYWQVRAEALYDLDTSHLPDVMAGEHLADAEDLIAQLRNEGRAIETKVSHKYVVFQATDTTAKIADQYVDDSIYIDPTSHAELSQAQGGTLLEQYDMEKIDGTWKVVSLVRAPQ